MYININMYHMCLANRGQKRASEIGVTDGYESAPGEPEPDCLQEQSVLNG